MSTHVTADIFVYADTDIEVYTSGGNPILRVGDKIGSTVTLYFDGDCQALRIADALMALLSSKEQEEAAPAQESAHA